MSNQEGFGLFLTYLCDLIDIFAGIIGKHEIHDPL